MAQLTRTEFRRFASLRRNDGMGRSEALALVTREHEAATTRMQALRQTTGLDDTDKAACRDCPEFEPPSRCWIGLDRGGCARAAIDQFAARSEGTLPPCDRRLAARRRPNPLRVWIPDRIPAGAWVSTAKLAADANAFCAAIPPDVDAVLGIARSGLIPAAIVAANLHLPLYAAGMEGAVVATGGGGRTHGDPRFAAPPRKVLVVDDTAGHGVAMRNVVQAAKIRWPGASFLRSVIYAADPSLPFLDLYAVAYAMPHYLEWNFLNSPHNWDGGMIATDLDGVLCPDVPVEDDDDGPRYLACIRGMLPRYRPVRRPVVVVTARLEKWRAETEAWLGRNGMNVQEVIMGPWPTKAAREAVGDEGIARWKWQAARAIRCQLFCESSKAQAVAMRRLGGVAVVCPGEPTRLNPGISTGTPTVTSGPAVTPRPKIVRTNLIYHCYPVGTWRECIAEIRRRWDAFTGRKILSVMRGPGCAPLEDVQAALDQPDAEWMTADNDPRLGEVVSFRRLLETVHSMREDEATFYGHTKAVATREIGSGAVLWRQRLVEALLGHHVAALVKLREYAAVGGCKTTMPPGKAHRREDTGTPWPASHYAGTLFWFRHDAVFGRPDWGEVGQNRYGAEDWIGSLLPADQLGSVYQPWPEEGWPLIWPYDAKWHTGSQPLYVPGSELLKAQILGRFTARRWGRVIELGPWNGLDTVWLAPWCDELVAVEGRNGNLSSARERCELAGIENVRFIQANIETFDLKSLGRFDAVWACGILYHFPEPWRVVQRIASVTDRVFGWTHVAERDEGDRGGYRGRAYFEVPDADLSGMSEESWWLLPAEFERMFADVGFTRFQWLTELTPSPNGGLIGQFQVERPR